MGSITFDSYLDRDTVQTVKCAGRQDAILVGGRQIRGLGGFAVFVNDQSAAVVKDNGGTEVYVGDVDLRNWFEEESCP